METWAIVLVDLITAFLGFLSGFLSRWIYVSVKNNKTNVGNNNINSGNINSPSYYQNAGDDSVQTVVNGSVIVKSQNDTNC